MYSVKSILKISLQKHQNCLGIVCFWVKSYLNNRRPVLAGWVETHRTEGKEGLAAWRLPPVQWLNSLIESKLRPTAFSFLSIQIKVKKQKGPCCVQGTQCPEFDVCYEYAALMCSLGPCWLKGKWEVWYRALEEAP